MNAKKRLKATLTTFENGRHRIVDVITVDNSKQGKKHARGYFAKIKSRQRIVSGKIEFQPVS